MPESVVTLATADTYVFGCVTPGCKSTHSFSNLWLPELQRGHVWWCEHCSAPQVARVELPESREVRDEQ